MSELVRNMPIPKPFRMEHWGMRRPLQNSSFLRVVLWHNFSFWCIYRANVYTLARSRSKPSFTNGFNCFSQGSFKVNVRRYLVSTPHTRTHTQFKYPIWSARWRGLATVPGKIWAGYQRAKPQVGVTHTHCHRRKTIAKVYWMIQAFSKSP